MAFSSSSTGIIRSAYVTSLNSMLGSILMLDETKQSICFFWLQCRKRIYAVLTELYPFNQKNRAQRFGVKGKY